MNQSQTNHWPDQQIPNDHIKSCARQLRKTADHLYRHEMYLSCPAPLMMVATFGIELYLKSLNAKWNTSQNESDAIFGCYQVTAQPVKGHNLVTLFDTLDSQDQKKIQSEWSQSTNCKTTFREVLEPYSNYFVTSRYPFEPNNDFGGRSITDFVALLDWIADYVEKMQPEYRFSQPQ